MTTHTIVAKDLDQLSDVATKIIKEVCSERNVLCFYGQMGAGKTTLIREICAQLDVTDPVTSPTFALVNEYKAAKDQSIYHFDFYRINNVSEAFDFGYEEYFYSDSLCLVEWPEKIDQLLPTNYAKITIEVDFDENRIFTIELI